MAAIKTETQQVWDFAGDGFVHRLIHNKADGKLVEISDPGQTSEERPQMPARLSDVQVGQAEGGTCLAIHTHGRGIVGVAVTDLCINSPLSFDPSSQTRHFLCAGVYFVYCVFVRACVRVCLYAYICVCTCTCA